MTKSQKTNILVVDDDPTIVMAITRWLTKQNYTPIAASHANEAKEILTTHNIDLALIDVRLPEVGGLELSQYILNLNANIPILLITAFADLDTARQALDLGVYEYITKPFDFMDLNASIKRGLQHQKLVAESRFYQAKLEQEVAERTEKLTQINTQLQNEIEERKKVEAVLHEKQTLLQLTADAIPMYVAYIDPQQQYQFVNKYYENETRKSPDVISGTTVQERLAESAYTRVKPYLERALAGEEVTFELGPTPQNDQILSIRYTPHKDENQNVLGVFSLATDITERKKIERQLVQFERLAALAEMSEGVSHNLNNILTGILGPAQLIELHTQNKEILHETGIIQKAAIRASDLIKRLSVSVKGESGDLEAISVDTVIDEALKATKPRWKDEAEANGIQIKIEKNVVAPNPIRGTKSGFYNIMLSVILNAIDAQPSGGVVSISTQNIEDVVEIQISDNGIGMSEDVKRRAFEPFFTTKSEVGKGLSLSSVYASVTRWGGRIHLDSKPNAGTTVTIQLPVWAQPHSATNTNVPQATRSANILIVEDEKIVRTFLTRALSPHHQVDAVPDGIQGLELFTQKQYDVVLVDLGMPHLPGDQVIQRMREISPSVSTILITGWHLSEDDPRYHVFDFHLQKPFESVDVISTCVAQAIQVYDNRKKATL